MACRRKTVEALLFLDVDKPPMRRYGSDTTRLRCCSVRHRNGVGKPLRLTRRRSRWGVRGTTLPMGGGRHGELGTSGYWATLKLTRDGQDAFVLSNARYRRAPIPDGTRGRWPVIFLGVKQDGHALGAGNVRLAEHGWVVVLCLQATDKTYCNSQIEANVKSHLLALERNLTNW